MLGALIFLAALSFLAAGCSLGRGDQQTTYDDPLARKLGRLAYLGVIAGPEGDLLNQPLAVAVDSGVVYVADRKAAPKSLPLPMLVTGRVRAFREKDSKHLFDFNRVGPRDALDRPSSIAVNPRTRRLFVADSGRKAIYEFERRGRLIKEVRPPKSVGTSWSPVAITFDDNGNLCVLDVDDQRARVLMLDGTSRLRRVIGRFGAARGPNDKPGRFWYPSGVAVAQNGWVFVSDSQNRRLQLFDAEGKFRRIIYTGGLPRGIRLAPDGLLLVADAYAHQLIVYTPEGRQLYNYGREGHTSGDLSLPNDVALNPKTGWVFVADTGNNRVAAWVPPGSK